MGNYKQITITTTLVAKTMANAANVVIMPVDDTDDNISNKQNNAKPTIAKNCKTNNNNVTADDDDNSSAESCNRHWRQPKQQAQSQQTISCNQSNNNSRNVDDNNI